MMATGVGESRRGTGSGLQVGSLFSYIYLCCDWKDPNLGYPLATLGPLPKALRKNYPGLVANFYRFDGVWAVVSAGEKHFREGLQMGDSTLLPMYGFPLLQGDAATALSEPGNVVITAIQSLKEG